MTDSTEYYLSGISAIGRYYRKENPAVCFKLLEGSIVDIAREGLEPEFPGVEGVDALTEQDGLLTLFRCTDAFGGEPLHPLSVMNLYYHSRRGVFIDRSECYPDLRAGEIRLVSDYGSGTSTRLEPVNLLETAALVSCFGLKPDEALLKEFSELTDADAEDDSGINRDFSGTGDPDELLQRVYLSAILTGEFPAAGLKLLMDFGFIGRFWPELGVLAEIDQSKEYPPRGQRLGTYP